MEETEFVEGVRVLFISLLCRALEPRDSFPRILLFVEEALELYHAILVHGGGVSQRGGFAIEGGTALSVALGASTNLVAHCDAVSSSGMVLLRGLEVKVVSLLVVDLQPQRAGSIAVCEEELCFVIRFPLGCEFAYDLECLSDQELAVFLANLGIFCGCAKLLGCIDEIFGVEEVCLGIWISLDSLAVLIDVLLGVWGRVEIDGLAALKGYGLGNGTAKFKVLVVGGGWGVDGRGGMDTLSVGIGGYRSIVGIDVDRGWRRMELARWPRLGVRWVGDWRGLHAKHTRSCSV